MFIYFYNYVKFYILCVYVYIYIYISATGNTVVKSQKQIFQLNTSM